MAKQESAVAKTGESAVATYAVMTQGAELQSIMRENIGEGANMDRFDLEQIHVPAGGATSWEVPTLDGVESVKDLEGVIVGWRDTRQYWAESFDDTGGGTPPDCSSEDGVTGVGDPGGDCASCPFSQWGSGKNNAQACRATRPMLFVTPQSIIPMVIVVPPSSLQAMKKFFLRLAGASTPYYGVITRLSLEKAKSGTGIAYASIVPASGGRLTADEQEKMGAYAKSLRGVLHRLKITDV
jgi:hypothetical protein